jgi:hypothetical protein
MCLVPINRTWRQVKLPIGRGYTNTNSALINIAVWMAFDSMRWIAPTIEDTGVPIVKLLFDNLLQDDNSKHKRLGPQDDHLIEERETSWRN